MLFPTEREREREREVVLSRTLYDPFAFLVIVRSPVLYNNNNNNLSSSILIWESLFD